VVRNRGLEEEREVGKDWTHLLTVDFHSREELTEHNHVHHKGNGQEGIFADIVSADSISTIEENLGRVLIKSSLGVTDEGNVFNDNLVVNLVFTFGVKLRVSFNSIIEDTGL